MAHSYAEYADIACPRCEKLFRAPIWLIIDIVERPDLMEAILSNTLNDLTCPNCNQNIGQLDAPLLLYSPRAAIMLFDEIITSILFSPAQRSSKEERTHQARALVSRLKHSLGEEWQDFWVAQGLPFLTREQLLTFVRSFPSPHTDSQTPARHTSEERAREIIEALAENRPCVWGTHELDDTLLAAYADAYTKAERAGKRIEEVGELQRLRNMFVQLRLDRLLEEISQPTPPGNPSRRAQLCSWALSLIDREDNSTLWVQIQVEFGVSMIQQRGDAQGERFEHAIEAFQKALSACDAHEHPHLWSSIVQNLATAYIDRVQGDRAENVERAIELYQQALTALTPQDESSTWAMTMYNLGDAYMKRVRGNRAENIERAVAIYRQELQVTTRETSPMDWAATMLALAKAYKDRLQGDKEENIDLAISALEQVIEVYRSQAEPSLQVKVLEYLAQAYTKRGRSDRTANNDHAVELYQQALDILPREEAPVKWALLIANLASIYYTRPDGVRAEHIEQTINFYELAIEVLNAQNALTEWAQIQHNLAQAYRDRIMGEKADNIERAIEACKQALHVLEDRVPPDEWIDTLLLLANLYHSYPQKSEAENLERVIHIYKQALAKQSLQDAPKVRAGIMGQLGLAYQRRSLGDRVENLDQAIHFFRQAILLTNADSPEWVNRLGNLGNALRDRFMEVNAVSDIDEAIDAYRQILKVTSQEASTWFQTQSNLGVAFRLRYEGLGQMVDLETAIEAFHLSLLPDNGNNSEQYLQHTVHLAIALCLRFDALGKREDIDTAIELLQQVAARENEIQGYASWLLSALSHSLLIRSKAFNVVSDIEGAVEAAQQALLHTAEESHDWVGCQNNFCMALFNRFELTNQKIDIDTAVTGLRQALAVASTNAGERATVLANLGSTLKGHFVRFSLVSDIDEAIAALQQALQLAPRGSIASATRQNNLGLAYYERFQALGQIADLESAHDLFEAAVYSSHEDPLRRLSYQGHLAMILRTRFETLDRESDLDKAIQLYDEILAVSFQMGIDRGLWHNNLANALRIRYEARDRLDDLDLATDHLRQAIHLAHPGSTDWARWQANLAKVLLRRFEALGHLEDLDAARDALQTAISVAHEGSSDWAEDRMNLGGCYLRRFLTLGQEHDRDEAIRGYEDALSVLQPELWPVYFLDLAPTLSRLYIDRSSWTQAGDVMLLEVRAINTLYRLQLLETSREVWLARARGIYSDTAYILARAGRLREAAVILEQGRAHSLNTALARDRADLEAVRISKPGIYDQYQQANLRLGMLESRVRGDRSQAGQSDLLLESEIREQARLTWNDLNDAIAQIRLIPGYETFLLEATFSDTAQAVQPGFPLVYLIATSVGSLALVLSKRDDRADVDIADIWVDEFKTEILDASLVKFEGKELSGGFIPAQLDMPQWLQPALGELLPLLGERLLAPIVAQMPKIETTALILIPSGHLSLVPLHVASYSKDGRTIHLLDEFTIVYVPSARVLTSVRAVLATNDLQPTTLVGVGNPLPSSRPLPFARAELESVGILFAGEARYLLYEQEATKEALYSHLSTATHIHLACHGMFDPNEPLRSHLQLAQQNILTLQEILDEERLQKNQLVVLSACQTAVTEFSRLPDEAIGLPSSFLQIGAPGVIGTLWSVNDLSTALLMAKFYEIHLHLDSTSKKGLTSAASALCRAQRWLRDLTNSDLLAYLQSEAPYLSPILTSSILPAVRQAVRKGQGNERPYADPYHWAGFVYYGAA